MFLYKQIIKYKMYTICQEVQVHNLDQKLVLLCS